MFTGILYQKILRYDDFFETKMKTLLENFYFQAMLPELIDSRADRNRRLITWLTLVTLKFFTEEVCK